MSQFSLTSNVFGHFHESFGCISGSLAYSNSDQEGIIIDSILPKQSNVTVVFQDVCSHESFTKNVLCAPVHPITCIVKDTHNTLLNSFYAHRKNNQSGDVYIQSPSCFFLSDITLEANELILIAVTQYQPFYQCFSSDAKKKVLETDVANMVKRYGDLLKRVVLYMSPTLCSLFETYSLQSPFHSIQSSDNIPGCIAQHVMGSIITQSNPSFEAQFQFGSNHKIVYSTFKNKKESRSHLSVSSQARRNGKLLVHMPGMEGTYDFMVVFKTHDDSKMKPFDEITESTSGEIIRIGSHEECGIPVKEEDISFFLNEYKFYLTLDSHVLDVKKRN